MPSTKAFVALLFLAVSANADSIAEQIDTRVRQYADAGLFSGVVVVARGEDVVYQRAFGLANREFSVPNAIDTKFHIASVSKPITAAAILLLADRGKLALDDPISKFVPDFPNGDRITVEQVLTHYSGLGDTSSMPDYSDWSRFPQTPSSLVARLAKLPLRSEPGTEYRYSNSNYHLLAFIIEKISGQSYGEFLEQNIFRPLAMRDTRHHGDEKAIVARLATGYLPSGADGFEKPAYLDWSSKTGNGSLYTTAGDLLKFHHALQHGGLLKADTVTRSYGFGNAQRTVGMFWFRANDNGHRSVYVGGSSPGFKAYIERFIDDDVAVIVLSNFYLASATPIGKDIGAILWQNKPKLAAVPARVRRASEELDRAAGDYQFDSSFFVANVLAHVERHDDYLMMDYRNGTVVPLLPLADGSYFDRLYWSFVRIEEGRMIYRNGSSEFTGVRK